MNYPTIQEGVGGGMVFIEAVVASSTKNAAWTPPDYTPTQRVAYGDVTLYPDRGWFGKLRGKQRNAILCLTTLLISDGTLDTFTCAFARKRCPGRL